MKNIERSVAHKYLRRSVQITILIIAIIGLVLILAPLSWFERGVDVRFIGYFAFVEAFLVYSLPRLIKKQFASDIFQWMLIFIFLVNAIGDLGLYKLQYFDKGLHFLFPVVAVMVFTTVIRECFLMKVPSALLISFLLLILCAVLWEVFENLSDYFFHTHIAGVNGLDIYNDTVFDLFWDCIGGLLGVVIVVAVEKFKGSKIASQ